MAKHTTETLAGDDGKIRLDMTAKQAKAIADGDIYLKTGRTSPPRTILKEMQHHLKENLPKEWDALNPVTKHPTLWEQLLEIAKSGEAGYIALDDRKAEELATEAVATTYGLELAMGTILFPGIRTIADFVGMPYHLLLQAYIDKYGDSNGKQ